MRGVVEEIKGKRGKVVDSEKTEAKFDAKILRAHIFGNHVTQYMTSLKKEDPTKFKETILQMGEMPHRRQGQDL